MAELPNLREFDWTQSGRTELDYIHSYLVDNPKGFYMFRDKLGVIFLTRKRGMVRILHDFRRMTQIQQAAYVTLAKKAVEERYG